MGTPSEMVILLHGIGRTGRSMRPLAKMLDTIGYATLALDYPWRQEDLQGLAGFVAAQLVELDVWNRFARVHFVTHSMGGLVAARLLQSQVADHRLGRVVMLGPPNGGSEVADALHRLPPYRWFYGPAGQELTTSARRDAGAPDFELGVIAGDRGWPYLAGNLLLPRPRDGRVAVARTWLPGLADHIVIRTTHSFMPVNGKVQRQVAHFLAQGRFAH